MGPTCQWLRQPSLSSNWLARAVLSCRCSARIKPTPRRQELPEACTRGHRSEAACADTGPRALRSRLRASTSGAVIVLHWVTSRELSAPAAALPLAAAGPNLPLASPLFPTQVAARRAASSPTMCASPPHRSLLPSLRAGEAPHHPPPSPYAGKATASPPRALHDVDPRCHVAGPRGRGPHVPVLPTRP
jgi:hypothetical protein